jgi:hypothetical protein
MKRKTTARVRGRTNVHLPDLFTESKAEPTKAKVVKDTTRDEILYTPYEYKDLLFKLAQSLFHEENDKERAFFAIIHKEWASEDDIIQKLLPTEVSSRDVRKLVNSIKTTCDIFCTESRQTDWKRKGKSAPITTYWSVDYEKALQVCDKIVKAVPTYVCSNVECNEVYDIMDMCTLMGIGKELGKGIPCCAYCGHDIKEKTDNIFRGSKADKKQFQDLYEKAVRALPSIYRLENLDGWRKRKARTEIQVVGLEPEPEPEPEPKSKPKPTNEHKKPPQTKSKKRSMVERPSLDILRKCQRQKVSKKTVPKKAEPTMSSDDEIIWEKV